MINRVIISVIVIVGCLSLAACSNTAMVRQADKSPDTLHIYSNGKMMLRDRIVPPEDVFIYPDGSGGEKAAVKLYVPYHPPFYRDHIVVERLDKKS